MAGALGLSIGKATKSLFPGGGVGGYAPWLLPLAGKALPYAAAGYGGYVAGKAGLSKMFPEDYYYNPTPETQAKQFGIGQLTPYARDIMERTGGVPAGVSVAGGAGGLPSVSARVESERAMKGLTGAEAGAGELPGLLTYEKALELMNKLGEGYYIEPDGMGGFNVLRDPRYFEPEEKAPPISEWQQQQLDLARQEAEQSAQQAAAQQAYQQQSLAQQQQQSQWQQEQAEKAYSAQLAANPRSWLEYAAYKNEQPAIQPWMQPLMQGGQAGQAIPGWTPESMTGMPQLTRPSRQYQARMGPTAQAQHSGYRQARTGITPEESQFRLWSTSPPGGRASSLSWSR